MSSDEVWNAFSERLFDQNAFAIKLGLDNIRRAFELEGHPETSAPAIVVGGTNGKGSTAAALAGVLSAHGLDVGLYTSPHLVEVRERFRINGAPVDRREVLEVGQRIVDHYGDDDAEPCLTFFEITTLMAALIFERHDVDVAVWEVGLGGRLDAVNAVEPAMTIVTNIGLDHQEHLGESVAEIAAEKAALHRPGVPLFLGPQTHREVESAFAFDDTTIVGAPENPDPPGIDWHDGYVSSQSSFENQIVAMRAARRFLADDWDLSIAVTGLARTAWPGRLDPRRLPDSERRFLLDAAHNPAGATRLFDLLAVETPGAFVVGAMADKSHAEMFERLNEHPDVPVFVAEVASNRAASADTLGAALPREPAGAGGGPEMFEAAAASTDGFVTVFGSVYLLGEWFAWAGVPVDSLVTYR